MESHALLQMALLFRKQVSGFLKWGVGAQSMSLACRADLGSPLSTKNKRSNKAGQGSTPRTPAQDKTASSRTAQLGKTLS